MDSGIKLLIVEDDLTECEILKEFFEKSKKFKSCDVANDGVVAIEKISRGKPNIILCDFVLPGVDGIAVLKKVNHYLAEKRPKIVMFSAVYDKKIINSMFDLGADYYVRKPVELGFLLEIVLNIYGNTADNVSRRLFINPEKKTKEVLDLIGVPVNLKGYRYIIDVVGEMVKNEDSLFHKEIYQKIGNKKFVSSDSIDVSITNAIRRAHRVNTEYYRKTFNYYGFTKKPKNSLFLNTMKELILREQS
ncbi:stage 0 sporulation protein A [Clostridia bacterium]|nr:stage 0 sporulation protein A [Clostridia bacterium]